MGKNKPMTYDDVKQVMDNPKRVSVTVVDKDGRKVRFNYPIEEWERATLTATYEIERRDSEFEYSPRRVIQPARRRTLNLELDIRYR